MTNPAAESVVGEVAGRVEPGVQMIGGEMRGWSDADSPVIPIGPAAIHALRHALPPRGRVLVAGPHDADLIDAIIGLGLDVDLLLRSVPDARAARLRHTAAAGGNRLEVMCGALDRLGSPETPGYDAVVALDGVERLLSPDMTRTDSWTVAVTALSAVVRPGGAVLLLVDNRFDVTLLTRVATRRADYWPDGMNGPVEPPAGYAASIRALARCDLYASRGLAVFPSRSHPALIATADAVAAPIASTLIAAAYGADRDAHGGGVPHLTEPRRLARDAVRHGLGFDLAPAWIVIATRSAEPGEPGDAPDIVVTDAGLGGDATFWSVPQLIERDAAGGWWRRPVEAHAVPRMLGYVYRDPAALSGPVADGDLLEERLLAACARHDHTAMRQLMRRYAEWLTTGATPDGIEPSKVFGFLDNLLDTGDRLELLDPSWSLERQVSPSVAIIHASRRFAQRLLASGLPHPWPSDASIDRIALTLIAMTGIGPPGDTAAQAVAAPSELDAAAPSDLDPAAPSELDVAAPSDLDAATRLAIDVDIRHANAAQTDTDRVAELSQVFAASAPAHGLGHREAARLAARRGTELADARAQIAWLDETVRERDEQLSLAGRRIAGLRSSITYRLGYLFTFPLIKIMKVVRRK